MQELKKIEREDFDHREAPDNLTEQVFTAEEENTADEQFSMRVLSEQFDGEIVVTMDGRVWMSERYMRMFAEFGTQCVPDCRWAKFHPQLMYFLSKARAMAQYEFQLNRFRIWRSERDE